MLIVDYICLVLTTCNTKNHKEEEEEEDIEYICAVPNLHYY